MENKTMNEFLEKFEEPEKSVCISEFPEVELIHLINWRSETKIFNGDEKKITFADYANRKVRIPISVIIQIKNLKIRYPDIKKITVKKSGTKFDTRYEVIVLDKGFSDMIDEITITKI